MSGDTKLEEDSWIRSLNVTRKPKLDSLLATQMLDPKYFRDFLSFCQSLAEGFSNTECGFVTADEVEGAARVWADRASFKPSDMLETKLFAILNAYSLEFIGWTPSLGAEIPTFEDSEE